LDFLQIFKITAFLEVLLFMEFAAPARQM